MTDEGDAARIIAEHELGAYTGPEDDSGPVLEDEEPDE